MAHEYEAVATRPEHVLASGLGRNDLMTVIDALVSVATPVEPHFLWRPQLRDADDEMVLEAAVHGGASAIVTFNRRDFELAARRFSVGILSPRQALENLR
jgi:predicted nucleic acid-binding protein